MKMAQTKMNEREKKKKNRQTASFGNNKASESATITRLKQEVETCRKAPEDTKTRLELDVSQQVKELHEQIASLRDASRSKDEFIRITNHELRTPLDVIRGNLDMVLKGETGPISPHMQEYLADALMGADRLTKLVNDMLDISRIEGGRMKFALQETDLKEILQTIEKEFEPIFRKKDVVFTLQYPDALPHVFSDKERIFQMIDNFLGNALKFTPAGGHVTLAARDEGETIVVSVQDTGIGIRPEDKGKLFKRFPQIDLGLLDVQRSTGLGLNLVYQLIEKLGGEVWTESPGLGKGATFSFRLPRAGSARAAALARFHERFFETERETAYAEGSKRIADSA